MATILVVDDELGIRALLTEILSDEGHTVEAAENAAHARVFREKLKPDLVLLDIWMPDVDGITLLKEWNSTGQLTMPVIMMSVHGTIDTAVEAMKFGATAFLEKPVTLQKLLRAVEEGLTRDTDPRGAISSAAANLGTAPAGGPGSPSSAGTQSVRPGLSGPDASGTQHWAPGNPVAGEGDRYGLTTGPASLPSPLGPNNPGGASDSNSRQSFELDRPLREARDAFEKSYFEYHLAKENGSMTRVAEKTGLERTHLYRKLKHLGVDLSRTKRQAN